MTKKIQLGINRPSPLHHMVKKRILELIQEGKLKDGDRLPPEETIAEENGISRGTVRTALLELSREGLIARYPQKGTFLTMKHPVNSTIKIGVVSPIVSLTEEEKTDYYQNEFYGGVQNGFLETGASFIFRQSNLKNITNIEESFGRNIDGILFLLPLRNQTDILLKLQERNIPLMIAGATPEGDFNFVGANYRKSIEDTLKFLIAQGHKKIGAVFSDLNNFDSYCRHQGLVDSLEEFSLPRMKKWIRIVPPVCSDKWSQESMNATDGILACREKPTVIIAEGKPMSLGAKKAIEKNGLRIPGDISLIGFDDFYSAAYLSPPLTTIFQPVWEIGELAVKKLVEIITGRALQPCRINLETKLVVRNSVAFLNSP